MNALRAFNDYDMEIKSEVNIKGKQYKPNYWLNIPQPLHNFNDVMQNLPDKSSRLNIFVHSVSNINPLTKLLNKHAKKFIRNLLISTDIKAITGEIESCVII